MSHTHPHRHPPLKGGINFRDFGGYDTADGRRVKWKHLFRSGHLANLTPEDHAHLDGFGIGAICDFRTDWENDHETTALPEHIQARLQRFNIWPKSARTANDMVKALAEGTTTDAEVYESQNVVYREFVRDFSGHYAAMFRHIMAAEGKAVLIHCAGGKDRTGLGAAFMHLTLGVPEEVVHEDYILTNQHPRTQKFIRIMAERAAKITGKTDPGHVEELFPHYMKLFGARADSLQAAFDTIKSMTGSFDAYRRDLLKVTDAEAEKLKAWYLE
ncbi:MAG: tyrosine-protein phosphatase [Rhodospirillaceae bacterium]|nr:tyrosine-protein phosphatase [Rhodospirillaceae bacterium]